MTKDAPGILAIWNDCAPRQEGIYEHWYRSEHLAERLSIPGFRQGRRFRRISRDGPQFFTCYTTDSADVLFSPAYRARVDDPTPLTRQAMSGVFVNVSRTICSVVHREGAMRGAFAVTLTTGNRPLLDQILAEHPVQKEILRAEIWVPDPRSEGSANAEQTLRGPDSRIDGCLLIETATAWAAEEMARRITEAHEVPAFAWSLMYELNA